MRVLPCLLLAGLVTASALAAPPTPFPVFTGERLYVAGTANRYETVREAIRQAEKGGQQTYYVVVVGSAGAGPEVTTKYADQLLQTWQRQARDAGLAFDADRAVLIVLAEENRKLAMHFGDRLQGEFGLKGQAVNDRLVNPYFLPFAKRDDYQGGLVNLVHETAKLVGETPAADGPGETVKPAPAPAPPTPELEPKTTTSSSATPRTATPQPVSQAPRSAGSSVLWMLLGAAVVVVVAVLLYVVLSFHSLKANVRSQAAELKERVVTLLQETEKIQERHRFLPYSDADFKEPMRGETLELYDRLRERLEQLQQVWLDLTDTKDKVEPLLASTPFLASARLRQAQELLARADLKKAAALQRECVSYLERLEKAHEQAEALGKQADEGLATLTRQVEQIGSRGLSTTPYTGDLDRLRGDLGAARVLITSNPLGAAKALEAVREAAAKLLRRTEAALRRLAVAEAVDEKVRAAEALARRHRGQGLLLTEDDPDGHVRRARAAREAAWQALDRGEDERAGEGLEEADRLAESASAVVEQQLEARDFCEKELPAVRRRQEELSSQLDRARQAHRRLEAEFAPDAWREVAGHLSKAGQLHGETQARLDDTARAAAPDAQCYLRARKALAEARQQQAEAGQLCQALGQRLQQLETTREQCRQRAQETQRQLDQARGWLDRQGGVVGRHARQQLLAAADLLQNADRAARQPRPDWAQVNQFQEQLLATVAAGLAQGQRDVEAHQKFVGLLQQAQRDVKEVDGLLRGSSADRPRANQRFEAAAAELAGIQKEQQAQHAEWAELYRRLENVRADLDKARRWAAEDVQLARQAEAEIAEAERELAGGRKFHDEGYAADVGHAERLLHSARHRLQAQDYETAIDQANQAERAARDAVSHARSQADARRRHRELAAHQAAQAMTAFTAVNQPQTIMPKPAAVHHAPKVPDPPAKAPSGTSEAGWEVEKKGPTGTSEAGW